MNWVKGDYDGKKILVTGHTGFKGTWLTRILVSAGADVYGLSLPPEENSLFSKIPNSGLAQSVYGDIRDKKFLDEYFKEHTFDGIFHLAAQALVGRAYDQPIETFETNVLGTANLLQSVLTFQSSKWAIVITTDKVYENLELTEGYGETDPLGGKDPYSASKAATEMVVSAWRTMASHKKSGFVVSTARAGNVIGGGDHAENRLVPDLIRSFQTNTKAVIRNPASLRPWQHVLDPLRGYLLMGSKLLHNVEISPSYNFGPGESSKLTVIDMADAATSLWPGNQGIEIQIDTLAFHESKLLWLCSDLAEKELGWHNQFDAIEAIRMTVEWERLSATSALSALDLQISKYFWEKL